jgi:glyoxylase-like metal-dependent hydrolase (beta-lactamase superfamily II)
MAGPRAFFLREEGRLAGAKVRGVGVRRSQRMRVPVPAFLVEHPGVGLMLVDTGFHPSVAIDPRENLGRGFTTVFKDFEMDPEQAVPAQLRELGRSAADVKIVVMTHLHGDHASAMSEFPDATFVFSKAEWEAATRGVSSTMPSTTARSTSTGAAPTRTPPSGARSICSATEACAWCSPRATRSVTCRSC